MIRNWLLALFLLGWATAAAGQPKALTGILTQITGAVQVIDPGATGDPLATLWQVVRAGAKVRVPTGGAAGIVCSTRRFVRFPGPAAWVLSQESCAAGVELTPAEYAVVASDSGHFKVVEGIYQLEHGVRWGGGDDLLAPLVLSPRGAMRTPRPTISWLRVPSATEYRLGLNGRGVHYESLLKTEDVTCAASLGGLDVCSLPWPADRPDLPPGEIFFVGVEAREHIAEPWRGNEPLQTGTPTLVDAKVLEESLQRIDRLGWQGAVRDAAQAGLFAQAGLYAAAAEAYSRALAAAPSPELRVTLADVYLISGLFDLAEPHYREALAGASPAVQAAAAFGLGRVEYARGSFKEAARQFQKARALYAELKLAEDEVAARKAAERAAARAPDRR